MFPTQICVVDKSVDPVGTDTFENLSPRRVASQSADQRCVQLQPQSGRFKMGSPEPVPTQHVDGHTVILDGEFAMRRGVLCEARVQVPTGPFDLGSGCTSRCPFEAAISPRQKHDRFHRTPPTLVLT